MREPSLRVRLHSSATLSLLLQMDVAELLRKYEAIWDVKSKIYADKYKRQAQFEALAKEMTGEL